MQPEPDAAEFSYNRPLCRWRPGDPDPSTRGIESRSIHDVLKVHIAMFSELKQRPADPILGLTVKFRADSNPNKIDLGAGIYKDELGDTPVLDCVKAAERHRLENETTKAYIGSAGSGLFNEKIAALNLGDHRVIRENRVRTISTPGGTGALRIAGELIRTCRSGGTIWVSNPTWANHEGVFTAAGLKVRTYPYYDYEHKCLDFAGMVEALKQVPRDDAVLLHACCHNPSGMDPSVEQWRQIAELARDIGFFPVVDLAYQGFGDGLEEDAYGLRLMADSVDEMIVCSSCSKNFGLYRERIGACSVIARSAEAADIVHSVLLPIVRVNYSMPPAHGAAIVETILSSAELTAQWHAELKQMRGRISDMRQLLVDKLLAHGVTRDFSFITGQKGMFSFLGIDRDKVQRLQEEFSIYIVGSSRISIAAITPDNVDYLAHSIAEVL
jgi:aspartate aminotransferase